MNIKEALAYGLSNIKLDNPQKLSYILLSYLTKQNKISLLINDDIQVDTDIYTGLINRLNSDEPIEYITNVVSFYSRKFYIASGALIPRPETEILIDLASTIIAKYKAPKIAEIGTGSGVIPIMLNILNPNISKTIASDISANAIKIAKINIDKFELQDKITLVQTNLLDDIDDEFDIIVSNPPYIADDFKLENNLSYEPDNALFGGVRGDELLIQIIDMFMLKSAKHLICEMGYDQKQSITEYIAKYKYTSLEFYQDLSGFDRGFIIEK